MAIKQNQNLPQVQGFYGNPIDGEFNLSFAQNGANILGVKSLDNFGATGGFGILALGDFNDSVAFGFARKNLAINFANANGTSSSSINIDAAKRNLSLVELLINKGSFDLSFEASTLSEQSSAWGLRWSNENGKQIQSKSSILGLGIGYNPMHNLSLELAWAICGT